MNVAIVGCGWIAQEHLKIWRKLSGISVIAVCDLNEKAAIRTARAWKIPNYYTDLEKMLNLHEVAIVDICTPPQTHHNLIVKALELSCNVLVEKPMAISSKEAEEVIIAQRKSGKKVGVIHNWLFEPVMIKALSMKRNGRLGQILSAHVHVLQTRKDPMLATKTHWCHSLPGGRFGEVLPHPTYILQSLIGHLVVKSVMARKVGSYSWVPYDELHVTLEGEEGFGSIYLSFNAPKYAIFVDIYGTKGMVRVNLVEQTILEVKRKSIRRLSKAIESLRQAYQLVASIARSAILVAFHQWRSGHEAYIRAFVDSVIHDKEPPVSLEEAYENVRIVEEICNAINY